MHPDEMPTEADNALAKEDSWQFRREQEQREAIEELSRKNTKMRAALLLIAEWKMPYRLFSVNYGSNGERDYVRGIASDALHEEGN